MIRVAVGVGSVTLIALIAWMMYLRARVNAMMKFVLENNLMLKKIVAMLASRPCIIEDMKGDRNGTSSEGTHP